MPRNQKVVILIDLTGQRFGRLIVIKYVGKYKYLCRCKCGNKKIIYGYSLIDGTTKSCGCLRKEITAQGSIKHGHCGDKIYKVWDAMIQRCTNPNNRQWKDYGGRGITVCKRWLKFENFYEDKGKDWEPGLTLERDNNELGYFKDNCYWGTRTEQARNKRNNRLITAFGKTQCIAAWAEETGIPSPTIRKRLKLGWPPEEALITPVGQRRNK